MKKTNYSNQRFSYRTKIKYLLMLVLATISISTLKAQDCWNLMWSDEFNGTSLDLNKWRYETGGGSPDVTNWGTGELETCTNRPENVSVSGGTLKITGRQETFGSATYTGGRIRSRGNFDAKYGYMEIKYKCPSGAGLWPAIWMLPTDEVYGAWPASGEIDIMENFGQNSSLGSTLHYKDNGGAHQFKTAGWALSLDNWEIIACVWKPNRIDFFSITTGTWNWIGGWANTDLAPAVWPFNQKFYMILNMAMGGSAGTISNTGLPKSLEIDYVRAYELIGDIVIAGPTQVVQNSVNNVFSLPTSVGATYAWTVPTGATITSGQGTNQINVQYGTASGNVACTVTNWKGTVNGAATVCGNGTYTFPVTVKTDPCYQIIENYEDQKNTVKSLTKAAGGSGVIREMTKNPLPSSVNSSPVTARCYRWGAGQYDEQYVDLLKQIDVAGITGGTETLSVDVFLSPSEIAGTTLAAGGDPITIQLINKAKYTGYPTGILAQMQGKLTVINQWQTVNFALGDWPDATVPFTSVDQLGILFNPATYTNKNYYFDNIRITNNKFTAAIAGAAALPNPKSTDPFTYKFKNESGSTWVWSATGGATIASTAADSAVVKFNQPVSGTYTATVTLKITTPSGCQRTVSKSVLVQNTVGVDEVENVTLSVYPNPSTGIYNLESNGNGEYVVNVFDSFGKLLIDTKSSDLKTIIDLSNYSDGIYILKVQANNKTYINKLIKTN